MIYDIFGRPDDYRIDYVFYYDIDKNLIVDAGGWEVPNIFEIISPNILWLFKYKKQNMDVYGINGELIELLYPREG